MATVVSAAHGVGLGNVIEANDGDITHGSRSNRLLKKSLATGLVV